jgi:hypothetical protein
MMVVVCALNATKVKAEDIYLNKMNKTLDNWYNVLDDICRGMPGGSDASNLACDQRSELDKLLVRMGCWNIYPATNPRDSSYWKCRR